MYTNVNVNISDSQKQKLKKALTSGRELTIRLSHDDLVGNDVVALTRSQLDRLEKAHRAGKGATIKMSKTQIAHNMKVEGGFLSLLAGLASRLLPALGVGALSSLAGDGLYIKKGGHVCEVETDGKRVLLEPASGKMFMKLGDGLYLKKEGRVYDGRGLLLGPNSPFRNIPILGMLL